MNKLKDKLAASIKPPPRKGPEENATATAVPQPTPAAASVASVPTVSAPAVPVSDLNDAGGPLHPDRIWPD